MMRLHPSSPEWEIQQSQPYQSHLVHHHTRRMRRWMIVDVAGRKGSGYEHWHMDQEPVGSRWHKDRVCVIGHKGLPSVNGRRDLACVTGHRDRIVVGIDVGSRRMVRCIRYCCMAAVHRILHKPGRHWHLSRQCCVRRFGEDCNSQGSLLYWP